MTTAAKTPNYTNAQCVNMKERYTAAKTEKDRDSVVSELAKEFKKDVRSIRAKMVAEKYYIKKVTKSTVTGGVAMKKDDMAQKLKDDSGLNLNVDSVAKMNKLDIAGITTLVNSLKDQVDDLTSELSSYEAEFGVLLEQEPTEQAEQEQAEQEQAAS